MPATDNKYPITYDGVDPLSILPSFNPYEGYPIKKTSSSADFSVVAIIRASDEHPWLSSIPATPMLHKGGYASGKKTGFFLPVGSDPIGYATNENTLYGNSTTLPAIIANKTATNVQLGGSLRVQQPSGTLYQYTGGNGSVLASLDDVFYKLYIKDYLGIPTDGPSGATGIYSIPGGKEFLGLNGNYLGPFPAPQTSPFSNGNSTSTRTLSPLFLGAGGFGDYRRWSVDQAQGNSKFLINTNDYTTTAENEKYGAVEGWHTVLVNQGLWYITKDIQGVYWIPGEMGGGTWWCKDRFSSVGSDDPIAPASTSYKYEIRSAWMLFCYAMPQRPATPVAVYRLNGATYSEDQLELDSPSLNGQTRVDNAKEISVSPNGKYLMLATDIGQKSYAWPRVTRETLLMFRLSYVQGAYEWKNAYIMSGLPPTASSSATVVAEFIQKPNGLISKNPITASMDSALNLGQFNTIAVADNANWVIGNNFGWTNKSQSTGSNSSITTDLNNIYPAGARAVSRNTQIVSQPTQGNEYGNAGSPTIAMAVSNSGVIVKADRSVEGRLNSVRVPIVGLDGSGKLMVQIDDADVAEYFRSLTLGGIAQASVSIDIDEYGVAPSGFEYDCTGNGNGYGAGGGFIITGLQIGTPTLGERIVFTQLGAGSSGLIVGQPYYVGDVGGGASSGKFRLLQEDNFGVPTAATYVAGSALAAAGSKVRLARDVMLGEQYQAYIQQYGSTSQYVVTTMFYGSTKFSSAGTNAYVVFHLTNKIGTLYQKGFFTPSSTVGGQGYWQYRADGVPVKRSSQHNIKSYKESLYANVTIEGQQVVPASPVTLTNALYGPFGACVAIDEDGETVAVSSPSEGYDENATEPPPCEGAVYVYRKMGDEGGGVVWAQINRITVPRVVGYFGGPTGSIQHIQFGSSLEFSGSNLIIGSRQGVYVYEMSVGLFGNIQTQEADIPQVGSPATEHKTSLSATLDFASFIQVLANANTSTRISAELTGGSVLMLAAVTTSTPISADLENPTTVLIDSPVSMNTQFKPNLTIGAKLVLGSVRCESKCQIAANLTFTQLALRSTITTGSSLSVIVTGGAGVRCEINLGGSYSGNLSRFVSIPSTLTLSGAISVNDNLFRINPYLIESSTATATSIVANLGYVRVELSATLYKSTSIVVSAAKLVTLGTSDARQANIFEVGKASSATIGGLGQRWIKRSDLQNSDLTTSVEWVEGQPPQLD